MASLAAWPHRVNGLLRAALLGAALSVGWSGPEADAAEFWSVITVPVEANGLKTRPVEKTVSDRLAAAAAKGGVRGSAIVPGTDGPAIMAALTALKDGDVLILNGPMNGDGVFGGPDEAPLKWQDLIAARGGGTPPRLALVILRDADFERPKLRGLSKQARREAMRGYRRWSARLSVDQLRTVQSTLNALAILDVRERKSQGEANDRLTELVDGILDNQPIAAVARETGSRLLTPVGVDRSKASLAAIIDYLGKAELLDCLCKCREPENTRFQCVYDVSSRNHSTSCRKLENGSCLCRANGCFRRPIPKDGECVAACKANLSRAGGEVKAKAGVPALKSSITPDD